MCESVWNPDSDSNPDSELKSKNPDSDSRKKGWIRIWIQEKRVESDSDGFGFKVSGFGFRFGFEMPGFAHHWFTVPIQRNRTVMGISCSGSVSDRKVQRITLLDSVSWEKIPNVRSPCHIKRTMAMCMTHQSFLWYDTVVFIDREAREIMYLVAPIRLSVRPSVRLSVSVQQRAIGVIRCFSVCWAEADYRADAVDRLLIF